LHWAAHDGRAENVKLLLANGADVHIRDDDGKIPGDIAAEREHAEIAALLRSSNASA
jgi:ankyrin repeat protein